MKTTLSLTVALLASVAASATSYVPADTTHLLGEVEVVESATKAPISLLPLDVKTVNDATIQKSAESNVLPVLRNRIPGMFVTERGMAGYGVSGGAAGGVSIRGVGGVGKVLFLIDGQPQWAGIFGHSLPDTYSANDVERVDVVSGPASLLYGSGAMGGAVNLITRRASEEGFSGAIRAMGGSFGTFKANGRIAYRHQGLRTLAAASYERSDGNRRGMSYWLTNRYGNISYSFSPHWEAGVDAMVTETKADNPGSSYREVPLGMWAKQLRTTTSVFVKNHYGISSGGFQAYYNWGKHEIEDGLRTNNEPRAELFHSRDYNMGFTLYQVIRPFTGNNISAGIDFKHWGGYAYNAAKLDGTKSNEYRAHVNEIAGYAMMQQALFHDILSLNAGVRLEHSSQFGNQWVPQAGFILHPLTASTMKFSYSKGFRSPNMRELYMYPPRNPDLNPERMDNFEVELRQRLLDNHLEIGLALYYINGDNMIQTINHRNQNIGQFINKGFEIDAAYSITPGWSVAANYAYLHTDTRITAAPRHKLFADVSYTSGRWEASLELLGIWHLLTAPTDDMAVNRPGTTESYGLLNARVAYTFPFRTPLTLFAKGENLTATEYQIVNGFPMPHATVLAGFDLKF